jgi:hypothetical protein
VTAAPHVWEPASDVERVLRDACLRNDTVAFLRTLAAAPLYLPGFAQRPPLSQLPVRLAINPNAPIGACLNADELTALAELVAAAPVFHPATAAEAVMLDANNEARPAVYLDALMLSPVLLERGDRREPSSSADLPASSRTIRTRSPTSLLTPEEPHRVSRTQKGDCQ